MTQHARGPAAPAAPALPPPPPPRRPRRTQAERTAATRGALVRAAVQLLAQRGYEAATTDLIAAAAGVTKGALVHHFGAKHELVAPAVEACLAELGERAREAAERAGAAPVERMRAALRALWRAHAGGEPAARALCAVAAYAGHVGEGAANPAAVGHEVRAVRDAARGAYRAAERGLAAALEAGAAAAGLRPRVPPDALARLVLALLEGAALQARLGPDAGPDEAAREALEALLGAAFTV